MLYWCGAMHWVCVTWLADRHTGQRLRWSEKGILHRACTGLAQGCPSSVHRDPSALALSWALDSYFSAGSQSKRFTAEKIPSLHKLKVMNREKKKPCKLIGLPAFVKICWGVTIRWWFEAVGWRYRHKPLTRPERLPSTPFTSHCVFD